MQKEIANIGLFVFSMFAFATFVVWPWSYGLFAGLGWLVEAYKACAG